MMDIAAQELKERIQAVRGQLLMVDFNENADGWYTCHVHLPDGRVVMGTFDDNLAVRMEKSLRHEVYALGVVTLNIHDGQIVTLHIGELIPIEPDGITDAELESAYATYFAEHDTATHLRQALHEVLTGQTITWEQLLDELDASE